MKMVSELNEFLICSYQYMHHALGYFDTITVLDHLTHACIAMCSDVCLTVHVVELTIAYNNLITFL